jgi:hypothetical protein
VISTPQPTPRPPPAVARFAYLIGFLVLPEGEDLNTLFEVLADWEHRLKQENIDFEELGL